VLWALVEPGGIRPTEIAGRLQVSLSVITRHVQALEQEGFVAVARDRDDRRSCRVSLTSAGHDELQRLQEIGVQRFEEFVAGWEATEVATLTRLLEKLETDKHAAARRGAGPSGRRSAASA
jgi:DNA-binding MarR family transcriptional regulator